MVRRKRILTGLLAAVLAASSVPLPVSAAGNEVPIAKEEVIQGQDSQQEKNWYALGRPMTEEEKQEAMELVEYYGTMLNEIPEEKPREDPGRLPVSREPVVTSLIPDSLQLPRSYSSIDEGWTPPVRGQQHENCWAYAAVACVEISMAKNGVMPADQIDLSEEHAVYYYYMPVEDPLGGTEGEYNLANTTIDGMFNAGGSIGYTAGGFLSGMGPVMEEDFYDVKDLVMMTKEELNTIEEAYGDRAAIVTESVEYVPGDRQEMKKGIMEYGSLGIHYSALGSNGSFYNAEYASHYAHRATTPDHAVTIVGWDDDFPKENFNVQPPGDGAWQVRNTWGDGHGQKGYFWLSYYDQSMTAGRAYNAVAPDKYDHIYHYDKAGMLDSYVDAEAGGVIKGANVFTIQGEEEYLKAVSFPLIYSNLKYSIQIYKDPQGDPDSGIPLLENPIQGYKKSSGIYALDLAEPIRLEKGDRIAVVLTVTSDNPMVEPAIAVESIETGTCHSGQSFYSADGGDWMDCAENGQKNFRIKAFTSDGGGTDSTDHSHEWKEEWSFNDSHHWHDCEGDGHCEGGEGKALGEHTGGTATCSSRKICTVCQVSYGLPDRTVHVGQKVRRDFKEPSASAKGYTGDIYCGGCDLMIEQGKELPALGTDGTPAKPGWIPNLDVEFRDIQENAVSSSAEGKHKLIIFYDVNGEESVNTIKNLSEKADSAVDYCLVEASGASREDVERLKDGLNGDVEAWDFCYDDTVEANEIRNAYERAFLGLDNLPLPLIVYVDDEDRIRHMTSGQLNAEEVRGNLAGYAGYKATKLNKQNPSSAKVTSLKGEELSFAAEEGRPKVLVFFYRNTNSEGLLRSISSEDMPNADIYAVDAFWSSTDVTKEFVTGYANQERIEVISDGDAYAEVLNYASAINAESFKWPIICYIDGNNLLQEVTMGVNSTLDEIRTTLFGTCGYNPNGSGNVVEDVQTYTVSVEKGSGAGSYAAGAGVTIMAEAPADGQKFQRWEGTEGLIFTIGDAQCAVAAFRMPEKAVSLRAVYVDEDTPQPEVTLEGISVTKAPDKTEYEEGEEFNTAGMEVMAAYSNKTKKKVEEYTVEPAGALTAGITEVTIRYTEDGVEKTTVQAITVNKKDTPQPEVLLEGISVTKAPDKTEYTEGEEFDPTGMEVTATYSDKTTKKVDSYTVEPSGELAAGTKEVTIRYTEGDVVMTTKQAITVNKKDTDTPQPGTVLEGISITKAPDKTVYEEGEEFDPTGMEVTATYSDDSTKTVDSYTVEPSGGQLHGGTFR